MHYSPAKAPHHSTTTLYLPTGKQTNEHITAVFSCSLSHYRSRCRERERGEERERAVVESQLVCWVAGLNKTPPNGLRRHWSACHLIVLQSITLYRLQFLCSSALPHSLVALPLRGPPPPSPFSPILCLSFCLCTVFARRTNSLSDESASEGVT